MLPLELISMSVPALNTALALAASASLSVDAVVRLEEVLKADEAAKPKESKLANPAVEVGDADFLANNDERLLVELALLSLMILIFPLLLSALKDNLD